MLGAEHLHGVGLKPSGGSFEALKHRLWVVVPYVW